MWNENENEEMNVAVNSNDVVQNELEENNVDNMPSQDPEPKKCNKKGIFVAIGVICALLIVCIIFAVCAGNSNGKKFVRLLTEDQLFIEAFEDSGKYEQANIKLEIDMDEIARETNSDNELGKITLNTSMVTKDDRSSAKTNLNFSKLDMKIPEIQVMKNGNLIGFNIVKIFPKVISLDMNDPEGLKKNLESLGADFSAYDSNYEYSEEDYEKIMEFASKYIKVAFSELEKGISKDSTKVVTLDGEEYKVSNAYVLKIDGERLVKTVYGLVKELSKNEKDMEYLNELGVIYDLEEFKSDMNDFLAETEEIMKEKQYDNILDSDILLSVYEKSGKTIATVLEMSDMKISLYTLEKEKDDFEITLEIEQSDTNVQLKTSLKKDKGNVSGMLKVEIEQYDEMAIDLKLCEFEVEKFKKAEDELLEIDKESALSLNEASEEELNEFAEKIQENIEELVGPLFSAY